jgi:hypothetical protein
MPLFTRHLIRDNMTQQSIGCVSCCCYQALVRDNMTHESIEYVSRFIGHLIQGHMPHAPIEHMSCVVCQARDQREYDTFIHRTRVSLLLAGT